MNDIVTCGRHSVTRFLCPKRPKKKKIPDLSGFVHNSVLR